MSKLAKVISIIYDLPFQLKVYFVTLFIYFISSASKASSNAIPMSLVLGLHPTMRTFYTLLIEGILVLLIRAERIEILI